MTIRVAQLVEHDVCAYPELAAPVHVSRVLMNNAPTTRNIFAVSYVKASVGKPVVVVGLEVDQEPFRNFLSEG